MMNQKKQPYKGSDKSRKSEIAWLCQNAKHLEKYSGQWVSFESKSGVVSRGMSLRQVMKTMGKKKTLKTPFVFHVPSKKELLGTLS